MRLKIATRKSPLALWQADAVGEMLRSLDSSLEVERLELSTSGDRFLAAPLSQVGGKGLFVKEIEEALRDGRAHIAVHSLKDMTSFMPPGLMLGAIPEREDPRDAWVSPSGSALAELPRGAKVGTASLRRACQLRAARPDFEIVPLRGNVQRRLDKIGELGLAGAVLAAAGLHRLGLSAHITELLPPTVCLPAVGQGALAVQCREDDAATRQLLARIDHRATRVVVEAERAFLARLEGGCTVPLAAYAELQGESLWLRGLIGDPSGARIVRAEARGPIETREALGRALAEQLLTQGGADILAAFAGHGGAA